MDRETIEMIVAIAQVTLVPLTIAALRVLYLLDRDQRKLLQWAFGVKGTNGAQSELEKLRKANHRHAGNDQIILSALERTRVELELESLDLRLQREGEG